MIKKKITEVERLQLIGLITLAHQADKKINECNKAIVEIVGADEFGYAGLLTEEYMEDSPNVDEALKAMKIRVIKLNT